MITHRDATSGLTVYTSGIWRTNSVVLPTPAGVLVSDPTYFPDEINAIYAHATSLPGGARALLLTHSDWDHVVGFHRFRDFHVVAQANVAGKSPEQRGKILGEIGGFDAQWYVPRGEVAYPRVDQPIEGDTSLDLAGEPARCVPTPGHTDCMMATFLPRLGVCLAGDLLSPLEFPFVYYSAAAYRASLDRMARVIEETATHTLVPGHGAPATSRDAIDARLDADRDYLDRLTAAVADGLAAGRSPDQLVASLAGFTHRGEPIPPANAAFHADNVRLIARESAAGADA